MLGESVPGDDGPGTEGLLPMDPWMGGVFVFLTMARVVILLHVLGYLHWEVLGLVVDQTLVKFEEVLHSCFLSPRLQ